MGHISSPVLCTLTNISSRIPNIIRDDTFKICEICMKSKLTKKSFNKDRDRARRPCTIVHADLISPITPPIFVQRNVYSMCVVDDFTRYLQGFLATIQN